MSAIHQMTLLPQHHRDPFDRIIIATGLVGGESVLSADGVFDAYGGPGFGSDGVTQRFH